VLFLARALVHVWPSVAVRLAALVLSRGFAVEPIRVAAQRPPRHSFPAAALQPGFGLIH
jgi:hypothetical protein